MSSAGGAIPRAPFVRFDVAMTSDVATVTYREAFERDGFAVVRGLFGADEVSTYREHYMAMVGRDEDESDVVDAGPDDPLRRYPRMDQMHEHDELSRAWLLDARLRRVLADLLDREPYAVQTMLYFKPPGARGQALHQDNYYLRARPGTCAAAWLALDRCDVDNGCLQIVPGSHMWPDLCVTKGADTQRSFTADLVTLPAGEEVVDVLMEPGDVLFFNGQVVHGSGPNRSSRFRRALIGHYVESSSTQVGSIYTPALRFDGSLVELEGDDSGRPCGTWVDRDGAPVVEMAGQWHADPPAAQ
jgi:phytanoyl-CoA hydroxylase